MLINFLVRQALQSTETIILDLSCSCNYENKNSQVGYFSKIEQILHYCQDNVIYGRPARTNLIGSTYTHVQVAGNLERCS
jgi:hypothetical protein